MPSPPPEAVAQSSASFVKGYAKRGSDQPPFASLLSRVTNHASFQDRPAASAAAQARSDDPSRRFDAGTVHAPASRDSAGTAGARPTNETNGGSEVRSNQPNAAPHAVAGGESVDRTAKNTPAREGEVMSPGATSHTAAIAPSTPGATSHTAAMAPSTQGPATTAAIDATGMQAMAGALLSFTSGGDTTATAGAGKGDDVFAIAGAKALPSDIAPRLAIAAGATGAAGAAGAAGATVPIEQAGNAGIVGSAGAAEDTDGDATASAAPANVGTVAPGQFAELLPVDTDPTDTATKSGSGRLAEDGGGAVADRPHATEAPANQSVNAALGLSSANPGPSAAAPAADRAGAVPLSEIAVAIAGQARAGKSRFDIRLDPPELGRIDVQLNVDRSGNISSRLVVERPETLDLLRRDAPQLERALQDAGLNTGGGMQFSLADQGFTSRNGLADYSVRAPFAAAADEPAAAAAWIGNVSAAGRGAGGGGGGLDITV
jgi:flagellar hook-length control protein FliK